MDDVDEDADGEAIEDEMDLDAEGEDDEDAEGEEDVAMTPVQPAPVIKISKTVKTSPSSNKKTKQVTPKKAAGQAAAINADNSDDDELSDLDSDDEDLNLGDEDAEGEEEDEDMDADGEEIEEPDAEGEPDEDVTTMPAAAELDSDDDGSRGETPDLSKMTQRQRARFEGLDESHYQALSNGTYPKPQDLRVCFSLCFADHKCLYRGPSQEDLHGRREGHATCRDGSASPQPQREAQRGSQGKQPC